MPRNRWIWDRAPREMTLTLDSGAAVTRRRMDTVVHHAMVHGWRTASDDLAVMAGVLHGAQPPVDRSSGDELEGSVL